MSGEILLKGSTAICINNKGYTKKLTIDKEYLIKSTHFGRVLIEDDNGFSEYFPVEWFKEKK